MKGFIDTFLATIYQRLYSVINTLINMFSVENMTQNMLIKTVFCKSASIWDVFGHVGTTGRYS